MSLSVNYSKRYDEKKATEKASHKITIRYDLICSQCGKRDVVLRIRGPKINGHPCFNCLAYDLLDVI